MTADHLAAPTNLPPELKLDGSDLKWSKEEIGDSGDDVYRITAPKTPARYLKTSARGTGLLGAERDRLHWLRGRIPVPEVLAFASVSGRDYLLTSAVPGWPACHSELALEMKPRAIVSALAKGLRAIHAIGTEGCPFVDRLDDKITRAVGEARAKGNVDAATAFLARPRPREDLVFTHGDYCEPNIIFQSGRVSGYIDIGFAAVADRYNDFGQAFFTLNRNGHGDLVDYFFAEYGLPGWNREKVEYFRALEDLFG